jgi:hypothetical protein
MVHVRAPGTARRDHQAPAPGRLQGTRAIGHRIGPCTSTSSRAPGTSTSSRAPGRSPARGHQAPAPARGHQAEHQLAGTRQSTSSRPCTRQITRAARGHAPGPCTRQITRAAREHGRDLVSSTRASRSRAGENHTGTSSPRAAPGRSRSPGP